MSSNSVGKSPRVARTARIRQSGTQAEQISDDSRTPFSKRRRPVAGHLEVTPEARGRHQPPYMARSHQETRPPQNQDSYGQQSTYPIRAKSELSRTTVARLWLVERSMSQPMLRQNRLPTS